MIEGPAICSKCSAWERVAPPFMVTDDIKVASVPCPEAVAETTAGVPTAQSNTSSPLYAARRYRS